MTLRERFTISLDDRLAQQFDEWMGARSYANRSEAIRDLLRAELGKSKLRSPAGKQRVACLAASCAWGLAARRDETPGVRQWLGAQRNSPAPLSRFTFDALAASIRSRSAAAVRLDERYTRDRQASQERHPSAFQRCSQRRASLKMTGVSRVRT